MQQSEIVRVKLGDLPQTVLEDVRRATGDYVVPIVADYIALGSGTLVQVDQWLGILTAQHVVHHPTEPNLRLDYTGYPERYLRTAVGPFAHDLSIPTNALRIVTTARDSDEYGPDLAFIALPPGAFLQEIQARKSFYNLTLKTADRKTAALCDDGFFALCGFPAVRDFAAPPELGFSTTLGLYGYAMFTGPEGYEVINGWDYYEMGVSDQAANEFERNFGGVSGGAIWKVLLGRRAEEQPGSEYMRDMTLAGVAFYQMDDHSSKRFFVRSHGPISLYDKFINQIRATLTPE